LLTANINPMNTVTRLLVFTWLLIAGGSLVAQVPPIISYQGKISIGATPFNGTGQFRFALVDAAGTTTYWSNDGTSTAGGQPAAAVALPVVNGLYVVPLGDAAIANMTGVPASVFTNPDVRLRVWFDDGPHGVQLLAPDQRVTTVGYAGYAMVAETLKSFRAPSDLSAATPGNSGSIRYNGFDNQLQYSNGTSWVPIAGTESGYRWAVWSTYDQGGGWISGNDANLAGGVNPSNWSDNNATADQISADKKVQAALFNKKASASPSAVVWSETWMAYSSTNGKFAGALFRVRNTTGAAINWTLNYYATAYPAWGEKASIALNGTLVWSTAAESYSTSAYSVTLSIPANRVSTVICVAGGSPAASTGSSVYSRSTVLAFRNNCLTLPAGLVLVDDLDAATGGYEQ